MHYEAQWRRTDVSEGVAGNQCQFRLAGICQYADVARPYDTSRIDRVFRVTPRRAEANAVLRLDTTQGTEERIAVGCNSDIPGGTGERRSGNVAGAQP